MFLLLYRISLVYKISLLYWVSQCYRSDLTKKVYIAKADRGMILIQNLKSQGEVFNPLIKHATS